MTVVGWTVVARQGGRYLTFGPFDEKNVAQEFMHDLVNASSGSRGFSFYLVEIHEPPVELEPRGRCFYDLEELEDL